jgi:hypothetical protein
MPEAINEGKKHFIKSQSPVSLLFVNICPFELRSSVNNEVSMLIYKKQWASCPVTSQSIHSGQFSDNLSHIPKNRKKAQI